MPSHAHESAAGSSWTEWRGEVGLLAGAQQTRAYWFARFSRSGCCFARRLLRHVVYLPQSVPGRTPKARASAIKEVRGYATARPSQCGDLRDGLVLHRPSIACDLCRGWRSLPWRTRVTFGPTSSSEDICTHGLYREYAHISLNSNVECDSRKGHMVPPLHPAGAYESSRTSRSLCRTLVSDPSAVAASVGPLLDGCSHSCRRGCDHGQMSARNPHCNALPFKLSSAPQRHSDRRAHR